MHAAIIPVARTIKTGLLSKMWKNWFLAKGQPPDETQDKHEAELVLKKKNYHVSGRNQTKTAFIAEAFF